jgi:hypothetical protein
MSDASENKFAEIAAEQSNRGILAGAAKTRTKTARVPFLGSFEQ